MSSLQTASHRSRAFGLGLWWPALVTPESALDPSPPPRESTHSRGLPIARR